MVLISVYSVSAMVGYDVFIEFGPRARVGVFLRPAALLLLSVREGSDTVMRGVLLPAVSCSVCFSFSSSCRVRAQTDDADVSQTALLLFALYLRKYERPKRGP